MLHDLKKRNLQDAIRINVCDQLEMKEWTRKFDVRLEVLKEAFDAVGTKINNLRVYIHDKQFSAQAPSELISGSPFTYQLHTN